MVAIATIFGRSSPPARCARAYATIVAQAWYIRGMKRRLSASIDEDLLAAAERAVAEGRAPSVSALVEEALAARIAVERRQVAMEEFLRWADEEWAAHRGGTAGGRRTHRGEHDPSAAGRAVSAERRMTLLLDAGAFIAVERATALRWPMWATRSSVGWAGSPTAEWSDRSGARQRNRLPSRGSCAASKYGLSTRRSVVMQDVCSLSRARLMWSTPHSSPSWTTAIRCSPLILRISAYSPSRRSCASTSSGFSWRLDTRARRHRWRSVATFSSRRTRTGDGSRAPAFCRRFPFAVNENSRHFPRPRRHRPRRHRPSQRHDTPARRHRWRKLSR